MTDIQGYEATPSPDMLLRKAESLIPSEILPDLVYSGQGPNTHGWHPFEMEIWAIGEAVRQADRQSRKGLSPGQTERIIRICLDKRARRGRQSFVMLLGRRRYRDLADSIASVISDPDISGHVIDSLYRMGAGEHAAAVAPFAIHEMTWIRNIAKKYIQKYGASR